MPAKALLLADDEEVARNIGAAVVTLAEVHFKEREEEPAVRQEALELREQLIDLVRELVAMLRARLTRALEGRGAAVLRRLRQRLS